MVLFGIGMLVAEAPNIDPWAATLLIQIIAGIFFHYLFIVNTAIGKCHFHHSTRHAFQGNMTSRQPVKQGQKPHVKFKHNQAHSGQK